MLLLLKKFNFELNYEKCQFLKNKIEFLGYIISPQGITLSDRHTNAINNFPQPRTVLEVQRFLGVTNYFRKFIKNYVIKAKALYNLLKNNRLYIR